MSERDDEPSAAPAEGREDHREAAEPATDEHFRAGHAARARSAAARAAAVSHYVEQHTPADRSSDEEKNTAWKAAHAARTAAQAIAVLAERPPDAAADSRCARNAAAAAAQASQMGLAHDGDGELAVTASRAANTASRAAGEAAAAGALGRDPALNAAADAAEAAAVLAAEAAGWLQPGQQAPEVATGIRSADLMAMMHL
ncbi:hypothetical protein AB0451_12385 [Streptomyces sp. NPDC052000]|uniref:hypothetical protein n=1 Tax=Streptomyces sp. NPDC052000 TaxID=3155676 RepID=UPI0034506640